MGRHEERLWLYISVCIALGGDVLWQCPSVWLLTSTLILSGTWYSSSINSCSRSTEKEGHLRKEGGEVADHMHGQPQTDSEKGNEVRGLEGQEGRST